MDSEQVSRASAPTCGTLGSQEFKVNCPGSSQERDLHYFFNGRLGEQDLKEIADGNPNIKWLLSQIMVAIGYLRDDKAWTHSAAIKPKTSR